MKFSSMMDESVAYGDSLYVWVGESGEVVFARILVMLHNIWSMKLVWGLGELLLT